MLLADDNEVNQQLIGAHIKKTGAALMIANDGLEAIAAAILDDVDLILMDIEMPMMDGITAVRYLREKGFDKPIYALTGNVDDTTINECLAAGCLGHLSKPIDTEKLYGVINSVLRPV